MSDPAATVHRAPVRGWCPGALKPMETGDGLIVRVRAHCGTLSAEQMLDICEIAERHGNGHIDLTRRANVQIRGIRAEGLPEVWSMLSALGLIDLNAEAESVRNVMIDPLAGLDPTEVSDVRPIVLALETALSQASDLWSLPAKFGFSVDGGGVLPLDGERADVRLRAVRDGARPAIAIGADRTDGVAWLGIVAPDAAVDAVTALLRAFLAGTENTGRTRFRALAPRLVQDLKLALAPYGAAISENVLAPPQQSCGSVLGPIMVNGTVVGAGIGAPFGRLEAASMRDLLAAAQSLGLDEFRLSPWRALVVPATRMRDVEILLARARECGFIADPDDPLTLIDACPGAPACSSARLDVRAAAYRLAQLLPLPGVSSVHVSGCAKGCARSKAADLMLVDCGTVFGVARHGRAEAPPVAYVEPDNLERLHLMLEAGI